MLEFNVEAMSCSHCVSTVTKAIKDLDPQARVEVDLPAHKIQVETLKDREVVAAALAEVGYPAS